MRLAVNFTQIKTGKRNIICTGTGNLIMLLAFRGALLALQLSNARIPPDIEHIWPGTIINLLKGFLGIVKPGWGCLGLVLWKGKELGSLSLGENDILGVIECWGVTQMGHSHTIGLVHSEHLLHPINSGSVKSFWSRKGPPLLRFWGVQHWREISGRASEQSLATSPSNRASQG